MTADTEINSRITCSGDVRLILCNGAILTAHKGITVSDDDNSLTIYEQPKEANKAAGKLIIDQVENNYAGIGGGGYDSGDNITINGGTVNVTGGKDGAGIGGGYYGGGYNIVINDGVVTATGGGTAAGIGGGYYGYSNNIVINDGAVTATGGDKAACIGGGYNASGRNIIINGGNVTATYSGQGVGIGGGYNGDGNIKLSWTKPSDSIYAKSFCGTVTLEKDFYDYRTLIPAGVINDNSVVANKLLTTYAFIPEFKGHSISLNGDIGLNFYLNDASEGADLHFEWYNKTFDHTVTAADFDEASNLYKVQLNVAAAEMSCPITATATKRDYSVTDVYSVRDYADVILNSESDFSKGYIAQNGAEKYGILVDLIKKTLDYGAKAQTRFGVTDYALANTGVDYTMQPVTTYHIKTKKTEMEDEKLYTYGLNYIGTSVLFLSGTTLRHNYAVTDDYLLRNVKDTANFDFTDKGSRVCFERKNIPATQLDVDFTFTLGESTYRYSVLDYCKLVIADENKPQADRELAMATFWYNDAAKTYFYYSDEYEDTIV